MIVRPIKTVNQLDLAWLVAPWLSTICSLQIAADPILDHGGTWRAMAA